MALSTTYPVGASNLFAEMRRVVLNIYHPSPLLKHDLSL